MFPGAIYDTATVRALRFHARGLSARPHGGRHQSVPGRGALGRQCRSSRTTIRSIAGRPAPSSSISTMRQLRPHDHARLRRRCAGGAARAAARRRERPARSAGTASCAAYERATRGGTADAQRLGRALQRITERRTVTGPRPTPREALRLGAARRSPLPPSCAAAGAAAAAPARAFRRGVNTLAVVFADARISGAADRLRVAALPGRPRRCRAPSTSRASPPRGFDFIRMPVDPGPFLDATADRRPHCSTA